MQIPCWNLHWGSSPEVPVDLYSGSSFGWACSLTELRNSWQIFSTISASHGSTLGAIFNLYTSLCTLWISSQVVLKPTSSMAGTATLKSCSGKGCQWPQRIAQSHYFCPVALVWANIHCSRNGQWSPTVSHLRYSSRNTSASRHLSASLTEMPTSWASFLVAVVFAGQLS